MFKFETTAINYYYYNYYLTGSQIDLNKIIVLFYIRDENIVQVSYDHDFTDSAVELVTFTTES